MTAQEITERDVEAWHTQMCQALRFGKMLENFPSMVERCLQYRTWEKRPCRDLGRPFRAALEYFEYNEPDGVGTSEKQVLKLIAGTPVEGKWRKETKARPGDNQYVVHDNIRHHKAKQGTSRAYSLERLERERPGLFAAVNAGEMSANAAMIEAGLRKPPSPFRQIKRLLPKLTSDERRLVRADIDAMEAA